MAWGSFGLVRCGNLTLTEVAPFVNQIRDLLKLVVGISRYENHTTKSNQILVGDSQPQKSTPWMGLEILLSESVG